MSFLGVIALAGFCGEGRADAGPGAELADRAAIERVYYNHRDGTKLSFEESLPPAQIEVLMRRDLEKEALLKKHYGIEVTPAMLRAQVETIDATTRAPEILAELKKSLGNDPGRIARSIARPLVVENLLRRCFENDDALHADSRRVADEIRIRLLACSAPGTRSSLLRNSGIGQVTNMVWQVGPRTGDAPLSKAPVHAPIPVKNHVRSEMYSIEATAQVLPSPEKGAEGDPQEASFNDLPAELQNILRAQLRHPGDVSAVIETPTVFLLYLAQERTEQKLSALVWGLNKRSYEEWLAQQSRKNP